MNYSIYTTRIIFFVAGIALSAPLLAQDDPLYFTNDFEDTSLYPSSKTASEQTFTGPYGEWIYYNCSKSTKTNYLRTGMGSYDLRVPKNVGAYFVLPVLDRGAGTLSFWEGRGKRRITVYTSTDGGMTWTEDTVVSSTDNETYINTVNINDIKVNRIKLANEGSSDADIDNVSVSILAAGTKATLITGEASDITQTSATVSGVLLDRGDQEMVEYGVCWSAEDTIPTTASGKITASDTAFSIEISGLRAGQTIYYRAYAITGAGSGYGGVKHFTTLAATPAQLSTKPAAVNRYSTDHQTVTAYTGGIITDAGGIAPTEAGVVYSTTASPTLENAARATASGISDDLDFDVKIKLLPNTIYYYRAYSTNTAGTSYGDELSLTTGDLLISDFTGNTIYCSQTGNDDSADGSVYSPFYSLQKAVDLAQPGDSIIMLAGTYNYDARVNIYTSGTEDSIIAVYSKGGRAILDFSSMPYHAHSDNPYQGVRLCGSYWHFFGIDITNAGDNGMLIERNKPTGGSSTDIINATDEAHDNIIEQCNFYKNGDTGLQMKNLAAYNKIINCDSYLNCDEGQGDADGFAPKISVGDGNYFYGCRAWLNSDDGYDVFFKKDGGFGDNMTIIMENCISYKNGFLDENTVSEDGNGNGFKMGSSQGAMNVYLNRCLAICNKSKGFDQNHNAGDIIMNNCTGMTLTSISSKSYSYRIYEDIADDHTVELTNCIAINDNAQTDKKNSDGSWKEGQDGKYGEYGRFEVDTTLTGLTVTTCEFRYASPDNFVSVTSHAELMSARDDDGNIWEGTFARLKEGSPLIDSGTIVADKIYRGLAVNGIGYSGTAPDLGAYEYRDEATDIKPVEQTGDKSGKIKLIKTESGIILLCVSGKARGRYQATLCDTRGEVIARHNFYGSTTAIRLPSAARGVLLLSVDGDNFHGSVKITTR